jgi:hypothetical protein
MFKDDSNKQLYSPLSTHAPRHKTSTIDECGCSIAVIIALVATCDLGLPIDPTVLEPLADAVVLKYTPVRRALLQTEDDPRPLDDQFLHLTIASTPLEELCRLTMIPNPLELWFEAVI